MLTPSRSAQYHLLVAFATLTPSLAMHCPCFALQRREYYRRDFMICKRKSKAQRMQVQRRWRGVSVRRTISWQQTAAIVLQRMERGRNARRRVAMRKAAPPSPACPPLPHHKIFHVEMQTIPSTFPTSGHLSNNVQLSLARRHERQNCTQGAMLHRQLSLKNGGHIYTEGALLSVLQFAPAFHSAARTENDCVCSYLRRRESSALCIQRVLRGMLGRQCFMQVL